MLRTMFHTQEHRNKVLEKPIKCYREDAWLGEAFYFWYDLDNAYRWGVTSKKKTGKFEIYEAKINCKKVLDTVFNEEQYLFWLRQIEKVAAKITKSTGEKPTLKEINDYFKEKGQWSEVAGIMFQDLPNNFDFLLVKPIKYRKGLRPFVYKKRIQLALYNEECLEDFSLSMTADC